MKLNKAHLKNREKGSSHNCLFKKCLKFYRCPLLRAETEQVSSEAGLMVYGGKGKSGLDFSRNWPVPLVHKEARRKKETTFQK